MAGPSKRFLKGKYTPPPAPRTPRTPYSVPDIPPRPTSSRRPA